MSIRITTGTKKMVATIIVAHLRLKSNISQSNQIRKKTEIRKKSTEFKTNISSLKV